jgi:hypothetical protein
MRENPLQHALIHATRDRSRRTRGVPQLSHHPTPQPTRYDLKATTGGHFFGCTDSQELMMNWSTAAFTIIASAIEASVTHHRRAPGCTPVCTSPSQKKGRCAGSLGAPGCFGWQKGRSTGHAGTSCYSAIPRVWAMRRDS